MDNEFARKSLPKSCTLDAVPWLFISWVFQKEDAFVKVTELLIRQGDDRSMDLEDIPIPSTISDKIKEQHNKAIESIITIVHDYITKNLTPDVLCSQGGHFACDANILGSVLKSSVIIGLWPRPLSPYHGMSFNSLATRIREIGVLDDCPQQNNYRSFGNGSMHGIKDTISASIRSLEDQYCGLKWDLSCTGGEVQIRSKERRGEKEEGGKTGLNLGLYRMITSFCSQF